MNLTTEQKIRVLLGACLALALLALGGANLVTLWQTGAFDAHLNAVMDTLLISLMSVLAGLRHVNDTLAGNGSSGMAKPKQDAPKTDSPDKPSS